MATGLPAVPRGKLLADVEPTRYGAGSGEDADEHRCQLDTRPRARHTAIRLREKMVWSSGPDHLFSKPDCRVPRSRPSVKLTTMLVSVLPRTGSISGGLDVRQQFAAWHCWQACCHTMPISTRRVPLCSI